MAAKDLSPQGYSFTVYRQCDVANFCKLLDSKGAKLIRVLGWRDDVLSGGYRIDYAHGERLSMETKT